MAPPRMEVRLGCVMRQMATKAEVRATCPPLQPKRLRVQHWSSSNCKIVPTWGCGGSRGIHFHSPTPQNVRETADWLFPATTTPPCRTIIYQQDCLLHQLTIILTPTHGDSAIIISKLWYSSSLSLLFFKASGNTSRHGLCLWPHNASATIDNGES